MESYPNQFPEPTISGYRYQMDAGLLRSPSNNGAPRQRRRYTTLPTRFIFQFAIPITQMDTWQAWVNAYAYKWIEFPAVSALSSNQTPKCVSHVIRFISDLRIAPITDEYFRVQVEAEEAP